MRPVRQGESNIQTIMNHARAVLHFFDIIFRFRSVITLGPSIGIEEKTSFGLLLEGLFIGRIDILGEARKYDSLQIE